MPPRWEDYLEPIPTRLPEPERFSADPRQLDLLRLLRGGPVPRGTPVEDYAEAMGAQEPYGPPQPAERVPDIYEEPEQAVRLPEGGGAGRGGSDYRRIVDEYLASLQTPYRLPQPTPYTRREKLGMLAARQPWQREMIVERHREPYERAVAEAQIGQRRSATAAGLAGDIERAQAYEKYRLIREKAAGRSEQLTYTDKIEQANADKGNLNYPYTRPQWKSLAEHNAAVAGAKAPRRRDEALEDIDKEIRADEGRYLQATTDPFGGFVRDEDLEGERQAIVSDVQKRRGSLTKRRKAIAAMTEEVYQKFRNLTAEQQEQIIYAYEKKVSGQSVGGQPGPVAPGQSYYP